MLSGRTRGYGLGVFFAPDGSDQMSHRRPNSARQPAASRPRLKGWRNSTSYDDSDGEHEQATAPTPRRPVSNQHQPRSIAQVGRLLTPQQIASVHAIMRLFLEDDLARGVPFDHLLLCQCCGSTKWAAGYVLYGRSAFCNECAAEYEITRLRGHCDNAADYLALRADRAAG